MQQVDQIAGGGDGLDELDKRRQRRRPLAPRNPRVPPPPTPAPSEPVVDITEPAEGEGERVQPDTPIVVAPPEPEPARVTPSRATPGGGVEQAGEPAEEVVEPLRLAQFYVTPAIDRFLRAVRAEALTQDLDVTASAVARMALQRLADETTPRELVRQLGEPKKGKTRGRPRR